MIEQASSVLRLDFNSVEFANLIQENMLTEEDANSIALVFEYLQRKKKNATVQTLLRLSRLPLKNPRTFENFDFSMLRGRDTAKLKSLQTLSAIHTHKNLAFIGSPGTGKTHLFFGKSSHEWLDMKTGPIRRILYEKNFIYMLLYIRRSA